MPEEAKTEELEQKTDEQKQKEWDEIPVDDDNPEPEGEAKKEPEPEQELSGDKPQEQAPVNEPLAEEPQYIDIVHNGQVHHVTKEKAIELAQKGFDYDYKVGPHSRIAKIITQFPEVAEIVDRHVRAKLEGTEAKETKSQKEFNIKPLDQYETADAWLKDNIVEVTKMVQSQQPAPRQQTQEDINARIVTTLKMHDPQGFSTVFPLMRDAIPNLTISEYQRIDSDIGELLKFYDAVKEKANKNVQSRTIQQPANSGKKPPFKVSSGKLPQSDNRNTAEKIWDLPNAKFNEAINRAKGFA